MTKRDPMGNATEATNPASGYALEVSRVLKANYAVPISFRRRSGFSS